MMDSKNLPITGIQHIGIPTKNLEATIRFYETFGFEVEWRRVNAPGDEVAFLRCKNCVIETYTTDPPVMADGAVDHIAMDTTDIQAMYDYALSQGYESLQGQICFLPFFENGVRFFTITGPSHEKLEFNQKL